MSRCTASLSRQLYSAITSADSTPTWVWQNVWLIYTVNATLQRGRYWERKLLIRSNRDDMCGVWDVMKASLPNTRTRPMSFLSWSQHVKYVDKQHLNHPTFKLPLETDHHALYARLNYHKHVVLYYGKRCMHVSETWEWGGKYRGSGWSNKWTEKVIPLSACSNKTEGVCEREIDKSIE